MTIDGALTGKELGQSLCESLYDGIEPDKFLVLTPYRNFGIHFIPEANFILFYRVS